MALPHRQSVLYKWTCPECYLCFRTREYDITQREARYHAWNEHRMSALGLPVPCMWDPRIKTHRVLMTYKS